ncbi:type II restriction endonuclease [Lactobacillus sp. UMNPBX5]|nr:type II restriction endonuclease [Lactobacillus sp. UMNPBX5]
MCVTKFVQVISCNLPFIKGQLSGTTTDFLYKEVIAPEIDKALNKNIQIGYFNLEDYLIKGEERFSEQKITQLYRFFSEENLLNEDVFSDSNKLNKNFYNELLYIMGLQEKAKGKSKVIARLPESKRQYSSLIEATIEQLETNDTPEDKLFDIAVQLVVVWINRLLFLKLLESSLVSFNDSKDYEFLNYKKLKSFDDVNDLFFAVMAKRPEDRLPRIKNEYNKVPYMNSSLFEKTDLEKHAGVTINQLRQGELTVYSRTKLRDTKGNKIVGQLPVLDYLFKFLNSYDFTSIKEAQNKKEQDQLINASVLGLIFEKINGYKDGSFFTPGKITMYMAEKAVQSTVITKINQTMGWHCKTISEIQIRTQDFGFSMENRNKISQAIDSLKVLDPAVGSGHFLVSVLNELIAIKAQLRVLFDANGKILNDVQCLVVNDELIVQDINGDRFKYSTKEPGTLRIQKALFNQKRTIIENCLYGVDINPNSVNICRLRLWIELLKDAYYSETGSLTTLPNIDINIKVGDSLIRRFDLNAHFDMRRNNFKDYLSLVKKYKNTSNKAVKAAINKDIQNIKNEFFGSFRTPAGERLDRVQARMTKVGQGNLFHETNLEEFKELKAKAKRAQEAYEKAKNSPVFSHSMEWRMEFPEVLDGNGDFVGWDLVIANPPYIFARNQSFDDYTKQYYLSHYTVDEYQANTYTLFMELGYNLLKRGGTFAYIIPNNMLTIQSNQKIRDFLINKTGRLEIINSMDKLFADANVDNCLVFFKKDRPDTITVGELFHGEYKLFGTVPNDFFGKEKPIFSISMVKYKAAINAYWKINNSPSIKERNIATVRSGIEAYEVGKGKPKMTKSDKDNRIYHSKKKIDDTYLPYLDGENVSRYLLTWNGEYIKYGPNLAAMRDPLLFRGPRILVRQIPSKSTYSIEGAYISKKIINDRNSMIITNIDNISILALLGIIDSKPLTLWFLMKFDKCQRRLYPQFKVNELAQFPIPELTVNAEKELSTLVSKAMDKRKHGQDISEENGRIDELVMSAFNLGESEKQSIRDFEF